MFLFDPTNVMLGQFSSWHPNTNEDNDVEDNKTGWVFTENNEHSFWFKRPLMFLFDPNIVVVLGQLSSWHPNTQWCWWQHNCGEQWHQLSLHRTIVGLQQTKGQQKFSWLLTWSWRWLYSCLLTGADIAWELYWLIVMDWVWFV